MAKQHAWSSIVLNLVHNHSTALLTNCSSSQVPTFCSLSSQTGRSYTQSLATTRSKNQYSNNKESRDKSATVLTKCCLKCCLKLAKYVAFCSISLRRNSHPGIVELAVLKTVIFTHRFSKPCLPPFSLSTTHFLPGFWLVCRLYLGHSRQRSFKVTEWKPFVFGHSPYGKNTALQRHSNVWKMTAKWKETLPNSSMYMQSFCTGHTACY